MEYMQTLLVHMSGKTTRSTRSPLCEGDAEGEDTPFPGGVIWPKDLPGGGGEGGLSAG